MTCQLVDDRLGEAEFSGDGMKASVTERFMR